MEKVKKKGRVFNIIINSFMLLLIILCLSVLFFNLTHSYHYVEGSSMQPTLNYRSEDAVISSKIKSRKRGDIIIVEKEEKPEENNISEVDITGTSSNTSKKKGLGEKISVWLASFIGEGKE
jgi:signal peptidase I